MLNCLRMLSNKTRQNIYIPVFIVSKKDEYDLRLCHWISPNGNDNNIKIFAKQFQTNLNKSGINNCTAVNIYLKEKWVYAIDMQ